MNIGVLTALNPKLQQMVADGLSDTRVQPDASAGSVKPETASVARVRPTGNLAPSIRFASLRDALDARITTDIASGQLTVEDAAAVKATLDDIDAQSGASNGAAPRAVTHDQPEFVGYFTPSTPQQAAVRYLATIAPGTLIDRFG